MGILSVALTILAALVAVPAFTFFAEILASLTVRKEGYASCNLDCDYGRLAVLVPAHNESSGIASTLADIKSQLRPKDRLLVVADNCSDDTAAIARSAGAEVVVRNEPDHIGKGYALDFGLKHLALDPPAIVALIDADCRIQPGALQRLGNACAAIGRPVQALNLMVAPENTSQDYRVATFAFRVKNWARPLGMSALKLPCPTTTGLALPWSVVTSIDLASGSIVEDIKLGLDLTVAGHPPMFCPAALIESQFPTSMKGAEGQRKRWVRGHLGIIGRLLPRLMARAVIRKNIGLLAIALDAAIPPLALFGLILCMMAVTAAAAVPLGASCAALAVSVASAAAYLTAIFLCWFRFGRDILPIDGIPSVAYYIADKLHLYRQIFTRKHDEGWVRADREK